MNTSDAVVCELLRVDRGGRTILPGVDLALAPGTVCGLLGPSGCGKTTLMRAIMGVQRVHSGRVTVLGHPAGHRRLRSQVAYVTQAPSVYADLTVLQNLRYFARLLAAPRDAIGRALATVDLERHAGRLAGTLSGGELARASLAVALLGDPRVLVLDEPTVGLDPVLRRQLWSTFHALAGDGATLLVSTHVMDEAAHCDRVLLMREGRLIGDGAPETLLGETGAADMESAFLALVDQARVAA